MATGSIPENKFATGVECLHYALNLPTSMGNDRKTLDHAFEAARTFKPLTQSEISALLARTREAALTGKYEIFKTTSQADGTGRNPQRMG